MNADVLVSVGGDLTFDCPQGRPSGTPTCTLTKPDGTTLATPTVTNDPVNTTINATASAGATALTLADASSVVAGRRYLVTNALGNPAEWVHVKAVASNVVTLHEPVAYAYVATDTFVGTRLTVTVDSADIDGDAFISEGYEARWVYIVGSTYRPATQWDVVRYLWPPTGELAAQWEFKRHTLGVYDEDSEAIGAGGLDWSDDLFIADQDMRRDMLARGTHHSRFRSHDEFKRPMFERVLLNWARAGVNTPSIYQDVPAEWLDLRNKSYVSALSDALNTARSYDGNQDAVVSAAEKKNKLGTMRFRR